MQLERVSQTLTKASATGAVSLTSLKKLNSAKLSAGISLPKPGFDGALPTGTLEIEDISAIKRWKKAETGMIAGCCCCCFCCDCVHSCVTLCQGGSCLQLCAGTGC